MSKQPLRRDATIEDVLPTLGKPEEYVRGLLGVLTAIRHEHGEVVVRIGITGTGSAPNYRIDLAGEPNRPIAAFDGATHKPFTDVASIDTQNWSSASMTWTEVRKMLGEIRGIAR